MSCSDSGAGTSDTERGLTRLRASAHYARILGGVMAQSQATTAAIVLLTLLGAGTPASSDEVNLSRYRVTVKMAPQASAVPVYVFEHLSPSVMTSLCDDGDGCTARLDMILASGALRAGERTLYKSGTNWTAAGTTTSYVDGDGGIGAEVVSVGPVAGNGCSFNEADSEVSSFPADLVEGFAAVAYYDGSGGGGNTAGFNCVLTLID
jgi:hypothetical protein